MFRCTSIDLNVNFWQAEIVGHLLISLCEWDMVNWQGSTTSSIVLLMCSAVPQSHTHCPVVTKTRNFVGAQIKPAALITEQFPKLLDNKPMATDDGLWHVSSDIWMLFRLVSQTQCGQFKMRLLRQQKRLLSCSLTGFQDGHFQVDLTTRGSFCSWTT